MYYSLTPSTPTVSPVTVSWARSHSRISSPADDAYIGSFLTVATELVENYLSRYLLTRTVTWVIGDDHYAHNWGGLNQTFVPWQWQQFVANPVLELPRPVLTVTSVMVGLWGQSDQAMVLDTDYQVDLTASLGRLRWITNTFANPLRDHLAITFTTGYGTENDIPLPIRQAIILIAAQLNYNRGDTTPEIWSTAVQALLSNYRYVWFS